MNEYDIVPTIPDRVTSDPAAERAAAVAIVHRDDLAGVSRDDTRELLDMLGLLDTARGMRGVEVGPEGQGDRRSTVRAEARRTRRAKARERARQEREAS